MLPSVSTWILRTKAKPPLPQCYAWILIICLCAASSKSLPSGLQVHPYCCSGQRVPRRSRARGGDHGPGAAAGRPAVELPGPRGAGGTLRPGEQLAQPGLHGIHLTCVWWCHCSGSGLSQLGKRCLVCLCAEQSEESRALGWRVAVVWICTWGCFAQPRAHLQLA